MTAANVHPCRARRRWTIPAVLCAVSLATVAHGTQLPGDLATTDPSPGLQDGPSLSPAAVLERLSASGTDLSILVGLAPEDEREAVRPLVVSGLAGADASLRALPADDQGHDRAALIAARVGLLAAVLAPSSQSIAQLESRAQLLSETRFDMTAAEALRRVTLAGLKTVIAQRPRDAPPTPSTPPTPATPASDDPDTLDLLTSLLDFPVGEDPLSTAPAAVHAEALAWRVIASSQSGRPAALAALSDSVQRGPLALRGRAQWRWEVLDAEVRARVAMSALNTARKATPKEAAEAADPLLRAWRGGRQAQRDQSDLRGLVSRVALVLSRSDAAAIAAEAAALPQDLMLIWARARATGAPGDAHARAVLTRLAAGSSGEAPGALAALATAAAATGESAVPHWDALLTRFRDSAEAREALRAAAAAAEDPANPERGATLEVLLRAAPDDPRAPAWRLELAETRADSDPARAFDLLRDIPASADPATRAESLAAGTRAARSLLAAAASPRPDLAAALRAAVAWADKHDPSLRNPLTLALADTLALVPADAPEARRLYGSLLALRPQLPRPLRIAAQIGAARLATPDSRAAAFTALAAIADELDGPPQDAPPPRPARSPEFWAVWAEMLRLMAADNQNGQRSAQIRLRVRQLRVIDPALGGGPPAQTIADIERSLR